MEWGVGAVRPSSFEPCAMADPFSIDVCRAHIDQTGQYSHDRTISVPRSHSPTRTRMHACTHAHRQACARAHACASTHKHIGTRTVTRCPHNVAHAVACAYGGVRDSVQMRWCSRWQRCRQIMRARWPRRALRCAQARQRSCESRRHVNSARAVALGTQPVGAEMPQHKPPLNEQRPCRMRHRRRRYRPSAPS